MKFKNKDWWDKGVEANQDGYGSAVYRFAERWADLMEAAISEGETLAECADRASHEADTEGITGFMYNCAVQSLGPSWLHGEELRQWHNRDVGKHNPERAEKVNEEGSYLNSAILTIG